MIRSHPEPPDPERLETRLVGAAWGFLVGSAIAIEREARRDRALAGDEPWQPRAAPGSWGAAGGLMLALLDSLLAAGFDVDDQARRAWDWSRGSAYGVRGDTRSDVDPRTLAAIRAFEAGTPAASSGPTDAAPADGAAAVLRSVAVALVERDVDDATLVDHAIRTAQVIDGRDSAQVAAAACALAVRRLLATTDGMNSDVATILDDAYEQLTSAVRPGGDHERAVRSARGGVLRRAGASAETLRSAWVAFAGAGSFSDAVDRALVAGDPVAVAPLSGAFAGARFGLDGIPAQLLVGLRGRHVAAAIIGRLLADSRRTGEANAAPIQWIDPVASRLNLPGRLGTSVLPGTDASREPVRWAALVQGAQRLRSTDRVEVVVLLAQDFELEPLRAARYTAILADHGLDLLRAAIADDDVPPDATAFHRLVEEAVGQAQHGRTVLVACPTGRGRSAFTVGCVLREAGVGAEETLAFLAETRPGAIASPGVEKLIRDWPSRGP